MKHIARQHRCQGQRDRANVRDFSKITHLLHFDPGNEG